ncbi:TIGR03618 family F420-dependent PPOX class oxidoreductase [Actinomycetospora flava]|uniref:TIGR03618 family F420-dependent PPOX class oxidoreductase n=1 Tax=Actinomycetospora flava TaxID=3129232 RepID=A0ABU8M341_9PSEU
MSETRNGPELHPMTEELATGPNFASVSTLLPSGRIQTQILWVGVKDGSVVINTETHRQRFENIEKDARITVLIRDEQDPYRYAEVRGRVDRTTTGSEAREHVDELARRYTGGDYPPEAIKSERVILWVTPERQTIVDQNVDTSD